MRQIQGCPLNTDQRKVSGFTDFDTGLKKRERIAFHLNRSITWFETFVTEIKKKYYLEFRVAIFKTWPCV